jgi:release factor glutamine methyltransferase
MSQTEVWTIGRLLEWTTQYLRERGAESPRLDAEVLLAEARSCRRIELYTSYEDVPSEPVRTAFRELVRRRAEGTPVAYLVGRREFYSLSFRVTPDVLIPRPETEFLLIRLFDLLDARPDPAARCTIADVGTGSGVLAVCAARHRRNIHVTAIDRGAAALAVARANAAEHRVEKQLAMVESDLFAEVPTDQRFDFVVSNPPYVSTSEYAALPSAVRDYEPRAALEAGPNGTEVIERLVPQAGERLLPDGWLLVEVSPMIEHRVRELLEADPKWEPHATVKDLAGLPRVVQARRR